MNLIPAEIHSEILSHLGVCCLHNAARVSRLWSALVTHSQKYRKGAFTDKVFCDAIDHNSSKCLKSFLKYKSMRRYYGYQAITHSLKSGHNIFTALIWKKVRPFIGPDDHLNCLKLAAKFGTLDIIKTIINSFRGISSRYDVDNAEYLTYCWLVYYRGLNDPTSKVFYLRDNDDIPGLRLLQVVASDRSEYVSLGDLMSNETMVSGSLAVKLSCKKWNRPNLIRTILRSHPYFVDEVINSCVKYGQINKLLSMMKEIDYQLSNKMLGDLYRLAMKYGDIDLMKFVMEKMNSVPTICYGVRHVRVVNWSCEAPIEYSRNIAYYCSEVGNLDLLRMILNHLPPTCDKKNIAYMAFVTSIRENHIHIIKWITTNFHFEKKDIRYIFENDLGCEILEWAATNNLLPDSYFDQHCISNSSPGKQYQYLRKRMHTTACPHIEWRIFPSKDNKKLSKLIFTN